MLAKIRSFAGAALLAGLAVSCASDEETAAYRGAPVGRYTVPEAMQTYARAVARSSRNEEEAGPLTPGAYRLDWAAARISIDSSLYSADVPIDGSCCYYRSVKCGNDSLSVPLHVKLVVVTDPAKMRESVYIRYYIPDDKAIIDCSEPDYEALLNSRPKQGFTGRSIYVSLAGDPVCVARYERGRLVAYAFLYENGFEPEENLTAMNALLAGLVVSRHRGAAAENPATRMTADNKSGDDSKEDEPIPGPGIEDVIITAKPPRSPWDRWFFPLPSSEDWNLHRGDSGGGGGGGSGSSGGSGAGNGDGDSSGNGDSSQSYDRNPDIKYEDEQVETLLDYLAMDCMGSTLIRSLDGVTILTGQNRNYFSSSSRSIYLKNDAQYGYRDYALLEELIHAYQFQRQKERFAELSMNNEVEAKVGWMVYRRRTGNPLSKRQQKAAFGSIRTIHYMNELAELYENKESLNSPAFREAYEMVAIGLYGFYDYISFSTDPNDYNFLILEELMINC